MTTATARESNVSIHEAVITIANRCDGAFSQDMMGFNRYDTKFGHDLARSASITNRQARAAWRMLRKYRNQLAAAGIEYDDLVPPPAEEAQKLVGEVRLDVKKSGAEVIIVQSTYNEGLVAEIKEIPGRKFKPSDKTWELPANLKSFEAAVTLAEKYGLEVDSVVYTRARERAKSFTELIELSNATDSEFDVEMGLELHPYQKAGAEYLVAAGSALLGDEMGLGKTPESLAAVEYLNAYPCLVICPAVVKLNWGRECQKWLPNRETHTLNGREPSESPGGQVVIINYDILAGWLPALIDYKFKSVIVDESHYIKNYKAKRTKAVRDIASRVEHVFCLSGTPVINRPSELIPQLQVIGALDDLGGFWGFAKHFCAARQVQFGNRPAFWDMSGARHLEELNIELRGRGYIRRKKKDVISQLPEKQRVSLPLSISNREEYNEAERDLVKWIGEQAISDEEWLREIEDFPPDVQEEEIKKRRKSAEAKAKRAEQLVRIEALKQIAAKGKLLAVQEWIEDFLESGEKLVVFATHREIVNVIADAFEAPRIMGGMSAEKRQESIDRFQNDPDCKLLVANIRAGGVGINLTASSNVAFVELGWTPGEHDQAEDRCYARMNDLHGVAAWYMLSDGTIEDEIFTLLEKKRIVVDKVIDGDSSVADEDDILGSLVEILKERSL